MLATILWLVKSTRYELNIYIFFLCFFFHEHLRFTEQQGKGEAITLTLLSTTSTRFADTKTLACNYYRELIFAHSYQRVSNREHLDSGCKSLTTKLGNIRYIEIEHWIAKRLYAYEGCTSETICLEVPISKRKWCVNFAERLPCNSSNDGFFKELNKFLSNRRKYKLFLLSEISITANSCFG